MPSQARDAFWSCDICGMEGFRSFDEAKAHELECRKRQRPGSPPRGPVTFGSNMGHHPVSEVGPGPYQHHDPRHNSPAKSRRIPLLGPDDVQQLEIADANACQNLEVFEATHDNVADYDAAGPGGPPISVGQVGIRCVHCLPGNAYSTAYPESLNSISSCVRMLSDRHLPGCAMVPPHVRDIAEKAATKRQRDHEVRRPATSDDERNHIVLADHCVYFCRNMAIVEKYPLKTGLVFQQGPAYRPGEGPVDAYSQRNEAAPGQFGQPSRPPLGAPMPGEPIAATPLARRPKQELDRHYQHSLERDGGYSAFHPQHPRGLYGAGEHMVAQTPASLVSRPESGPESAHQPPPQAIHPHEAPMGYMHPYDMPPQNNFPYYQDVNGSWICRYCSSFHPQYREHGAIWSSPAHSPPPTHVIDQHLAVCRGYNQGLPPPYHYQSPPPPPSHHYAYGPPQPPSPYGTQSPYHHGPPPGWGSPSHHQHPSSIHPSHYVHHPEASFAYHHQPHEPPPPLLHPQGPEPHADLTSAVAPRGTQPSSAPSRQETSDASIRQAIELLTNADKQHLGSEKKDKGEHEQLLVLEEDKLLLTDYFFHLMRQLKLCRFSESDRKTRGGKRENIAVGYGGLQCVHCADAPNSRKFFWSNVDRLANSFAEIPGHVLKCRRCPNNIKNALMDLKRRHPEQMARLPRGSQKVFFRRMWRRLHDEDPEPKQPTAEDLKVQSPPDKAETHPDEQGTSGSPTKAEERQPESPGTSGDESSLLVERSTSDAAKVLAASAMRSVPPSPSSRVLLAITDDKEWLSDMDCFIRRNLEVFCATDSDVETAQQDRKYPVNVGQVGIRCIHCALSKGGTGARGTAVAFPYSINGIYESVREFQRLHLESCPNLPKAVKTKLAGFKGSASLSSVLRKYYVLAAKALGMHDTPDGIRSGGEPVPLGSSAASAFAFSENQATRGVADQLRGPTSSGGFLEPAVTPLESRKRKNPPLPEASSDSGSKRSYTGETMREK